LNILSLPAGFPLALGFAEQLSLLTIDLFENDNKDIQNLVRHTKALSICLESMCKVVTRLNCPQPLKVLILCQLAQVTQTLCYTLKNSSEKKFYSFPNEFLLSAHQEIVKVYESEVTKFTPKSKSLTFPPAGSVGSGGSGKFSTYFQALLEFLVTAAKYQKQFHGFEVISSGVFKPPQAIIALSVSAPSITRSSSSEAGAAAAAAPVPSVSDLTRKVKKGRPRKQLSKKDVLEDSSDKKNDWLSQVNAAICSVMSVLLEEPRGCVSPNAALAPHWKDTPASRMIIITGIL